MKTIPVRSRKKNQNGNTLIEFALMSTFLLLLTFGVTDFARVSTVGVTVVDAAEAGTAFGALSPAHNRDLANIKVAAEANAQNVAGLTATASNFCACTMGGSHVDCDARDTICTGEGQHPELWIQVAVSMPFAMTFKMPGLPGDFTVNHTHTVQVQ